MQGIIELLYIVGLVVFTAIFSIVFDEKNRKNLSAFLNLFFESFHLNNAATFIGYTVFDNNNIFMIMYVYSMCIFLLEHFFVIEDNLMNKAVKIGQIVVFILGIIGQAICVHTILCSSQQ